MKRAGLADLVCFPFLLTLDRPDGPIWRYREDHVLSLLSAEEREIWQAARAKAEAEGLLMMANPLHCAVGRKAYRLEHRRLAGPARRFDVAFSAAAAAVSPLQPACPAAATARPGCRAL